MRLDARLPPGAALAALVAVSACGADTVQPSDESAADATQSDASGDLAPGSDASAEPSYTPPDFVGCTPTHLPAAGEGLWTWSLPWPYGGALQAAWGFGPDDVWAAGEVGLMLHYDGEAWRFVDAGTHEDIHQLWGAAPDDLWAAAGAGGLLHYDGVAWERVDVDVADTGHVRAVHGFSADDVWVAADSGVLRFHGGQWSSVPIVPDYPSDHPLYGTDEPASVLALGGTGPDDLWAVGVEGLMAHFDGSAWAVSYRFDVLRFPPDQKDFPILLSVHATADAVFVGGNAGYVIRGEGQTEVNSWARHDVPDGGIVAFHSPAPGAVFATAHSAIARWQGAGWDVYPRELDFSDQPFVQGGVVSKSLLTMYGASADDIWAFGHLGAFAHFDGSRLAVLERSPMALEIFSVHGDGAGGVWASGSGGVVLWGDAGRWCEIKPHSFEHELARAVWADGPDFVLTALGDELHAWDGTSWRRALEGLASEIVDLWGSARDDVWAVGPELLHFDGDAWAPASDPPEAELRRIWGAAADDVWAIGGASVFHFDGNAWEEAYADPDGRALFDIEGSRDGQHVWVAGEGLLLHWDGASWASHVHADKATSMAVGDDGLVWLTLTVPASLPTTSEVRYGDGESWTVEPLPRGVYALDLWVGPEGVWLVGSLGRVLLRPSGG